MDLNDNNLYKLLSTLMASALARDVPTGRLDSLKFRATHEASLRDAIHGQNSFLFSIVAERVLAPLREERACPAIILREVGVRRHLQVKHLTKQ